MKRLSFFVLLLSPFIFFCSAQNVLAQTSVQNNQTVVLAKDQVVDSDYVVKGNTIDIAGTVNGDVYALGGTITVEGTINGDLLAAGGNINLKGNVTGNVRIVGGNIIVTGTVGRNFSSLGGSLNITNSARVNGSVTSAGGTFVIDGPVSKDIRIAGGQITLGNTVGGNIFAYTGQLSISPSANIAGQVTYWSNQKAQIVAGAIIAGKVTQNVLPKKTFSDQAKPAKVASRLTAFFAFGKTISFLASFVTGLIAINFFPLYIQKVTAATKNGFWKNVGIGFITMIIAPILIILLLATLIGIPLAIFAGMLFAISLYLAGIIASIAIGKWAIRYVAQKDHIVWSLFVGLIIYKILGLVPIFGWIFSLIFITAGLGAILKERKHDYSELRAKKLI